MTISRCDMGRMARYLAATLSFAGAGTALAETPSGLRFKLAEIMTEPVGAHIEAVRAVRLRYVAPELVDQDRYSFEVIEPDFLHLCEADGIGYVSASAPKAQQIIVSMASELLSFGETAPNVVQYFDAFRVEAGHCIWEGL